jgi:outer membrane biosynthesis protein TonB
MEQIEQITQKKFNEVVGSLQKVMESLEIEFKEVIGSPKEQRELFMKNVESIPESKEGDVPDEVAVVYNNFVDGKLEDVVAWEEVKKEEKKKEVIKADDPIPEKVIPKVVKAKKETKVVPKVAKKEEKSKVEKEVKEEKRSKKESKVVPAEKEVKVKEVKIPKERKERAKEKDLSVFGHRANSLAGVLDTMFNSGITLKDAIHTLLEKFPKKNEYQVGERFFGYIRLLEKD